MKVLLYATFILRFYIQLLKTKEKKSWKVDVCGEIFNYINQILYYFFVYCSLFLSSTDL